VTGGLLERLRRVARLAADPRTPRLPRAALLGAVVYLLMPVDLVPEWFVPVFGYLDDLVLLWMALRWLIRSGPDDAPQASAPPT